MRTYTVTFFERHTRTVNADSITAAGILAQQFVRTLNAPGDPAHPGYYLHSVVQLDHLTSVTMPPHQQDPAGTTL